MYSGLVSAWGFRGPQTRALEFPDGEPQDELSPRSRCRLRYNDLTKRLELSVDEGPYLPFGPAGGGAWTPEKQFYADQLESPVTADWAVNALAPAAADSNNSGLTVRLFDDTTEEGVGFSVLVPTGAVNMTLTIVGRAETAPGAVAGVVLNLYERGVPDDAAVDAWSSARALTALSIPTNENFQYDSETDTLAGWGLTAGQVHQFELTRDPGAGGDTLVGDWDMLLVKVEFS